MGKCVKCLVVVLTAGFSAFGGADPRTDMLSEFINNYLNTRQDQICLEFESIPKETCHALVRAAAESTAGLDIDEETLKETIRNDLRQPEFLNTILAKAYGDDNPLGLEFKSLDSENMDGTVLGLAFDVHKDISKFSIDTTGNWRKQTSLNFQASGTLVNDSDENPRDFIEAKLSALKSYTTDIPEQDEAFADNLTDAAVLAAPACAGPGAADTDACKDAKADAYALLDSTGDFLRAFQRYEIGLVAGYEADQKRDAEQSTLGLAVFGQYEDWGSHSWAGGLRITPSVLIGIDKVNPNDETPRALAGDDSAYYRFSGEVSLWIPVGTYFDHHLTLTANYRYYRELNPSAIVEAANLDSYLLRTYSLTMPTGLFVSYSSGKLPFALQSDDVVALGWKVYF